MDKSLLKLTAIHAGILVPFMLFWPAMITSGVFFILRLTEHIAWSWWWVFSPLLILAGLFAAVLLWAVACLALNNKS